MQHTIRFVDSDLRFNVPYDIEINGDNLPSQFLRLVQKKLNLTQQNQTCTSKSEDPITQNTK